MESAPVVEIKKISEIKGGQLFFAHDFDKQVIAVKLNIDDSGQTPQRLGIKGIPTLILFNGGTEAERVVGNTSKDNISRMIDRALGAAS